MTNPTELNLLGLCRVVTQFCVQHITLLLCPLVSHVSFLYTSPVECSFLYASQWKKILFFQG